MRFSALFRLFFFGCCLLAAWTVQGAPDTSKNDLSIEEQAIRKRILNRAEKYLESLRRNPTQRISSHSLVVRGLLQAGISSKHPLLRELSKVLSQMEPRNDSETELLKKSAALLRIANKTTIFRDADCLCLRAEVFSDAYAEIYHRFGVICLPRGFDPNRRSNNRSDFPEDGFDTQLAAGSGLTTSLRKSDLDPATKPLPLSLSFFYGNAQRFPAVSVEPTGYVLIAQCDRQRK